MAVVSLRARFEGTNRQNLIDELKRQEFVNGCDDLAHAFAKMGKLVEFCHGDKIIEEGARDNDLYLLIVGSVSVIIKRNDYRLRTAGSHVGEMAAIEPSQPRSATVIAINSVLAADSPRSRSPILF